MSAVDSKNDIITETREHILRIQINRPEKKNALTRAMYAAMAAAIARADDDNGIRAVFLHGTADCFTAGNDLKDFQAFRQDGNNEDVSKFLSTISCAKKPIVAAVGGVAVGVGGGMPEPPAENIKKFFEYNRIECLGSVVGQGPACCFTCGYGETCKVGAIHMFFGPDTKITPELVPDLAKQPEPIAEAHRLGAELNRRLKGFAQAT